MKHKILFAVSCLLLFGCKSNPHKVENVETKLEKAAVVSGTEQVGVKNGEMVVVDKVQMAEKLRDLQNGVFSIEDKVYGTRKLGSLGLYGELKACQRKLASRQFGGTGTLVWTEPLDRVSDKEEDLKVGLDEKKNLVGLSEEHLKVRLNRFAGYKTILQQRFDEFREKIDACKSELANRALDAGQSSKVMVQESPKSSVDKVAINQFMCGFVRSGAGLQNLMLNVFAKGWLSLGDFKLDQNMTSVSVKDSDGVSKENALLFNGWKLSFDRGGVTMGELLNGTRDAQLTAWTYDRKGDVSAASQCLASGEGRWNP